MESCVYAEMVAGSIRWRPGLLTLMAIAVYWSIRGPFQSRGRLRVAFTADSLPERTLPEMRGPVSPKKCVLQDH